MRWRRFYLLILVPFLPLTKILGAQGMKRVFLNYLVGLSEEELTTLGEEFVQDMLPDVFYNDMLKVVEEQKKSGRLMVLSSASPSIWVKPIARELGFDHYFATELEIKDRVTLFPDIPEGNNKGFNKLVKMQHILPEGFDLSGDEKLPNSIGFSDSHADLPMLNICEDAAMVNPTERLLREGTSKGWKLYSPDRPTNGKKEFAIACLRQALGMW